jgi:hypothetical protein
MLGLEAIPTPSVISWATKSGRFPATPWACEAISASLRGVATVAGGQGVSRVS